MENKATPLRPSKPDSASASAMGLEIDLELMTQEDVGKTPVPPGTPDLRMPRLVDPDFPLSSAMGLEIDLELSDQSADDFQVPPGTRDLRVPLRPLTNGY